MVASLMERMKSVGSVKMAETMSESSFFNVRDSVKTNLYALNIALGGSLDGGLTPGMTVIAGPSRSFKTCISLYMIAAYQKAYPESVCLYYDSEFGSTPDYLKAFGVDPNKVIHIPIEHVEQLKFDIVKRLEEIKKGDKVVVFIDSIGNLASKKESEDALDEKSVADMSRSKAIKSLFRIITPHLTMKDIPAICVAHVYNTMEMYSKTIVSGGTGIMYSANAVWIIGRQTEKEGQVVTGYNFIINVEKSRFVKEKSKIPISVSHKGGISKYSGLQDLAIEAGFIIQKGAWYQLADPTTGEVDEGQKKLRGKDIGTKEVLEPIINSEKFKTFIEHKYKLSAMQIDDSTATEADDYIADVLDDEDE